MVKFDESRLSNPAGAGKIKCAGVRCHSSGGRHVSRIAKNAKKRIVYVLIAAMVLTLVSPVGTTIQSAVKKNVAIKKIVLNHSKYKLKEGKKLKLKVSYKPKRAKKKAIIWKSSKTKVATVSKKGVVKARRVGKTTILARVKGTKKKATCKIQVVKASASKETDTDEDENWTGDPSWDDDSQAGSNVQKTPTATPPSGNNTAAPTLGATASPVSPTPKYEKPEETAVPVNRLDLTAENAFFCEPPEGASVVSNEDGSITVTFAKPDAALNFYLPDNAQNYYSNYKSVVITYTSTGDLSHSLFDANMAGAADMGAGKHPDPGNKLTASEQENTLVFSVTNDCVGGCIRGLQIFNTNPLSDGQSITITIKSIIFCDKEDPTEEDLRPIETEAPEATETPRPTEDLEPVPLETDDPSPVPTGTLPPAKTLVPVPTATSIPELPSSTIGPIMQPTGNPTQAPAGNPTQASAGNPTQAPAGNATQAPGGNATQVPEGNATQVPGGNPTQAPGGNATQAPTGNPTPVPTPTGKPTPTPFVPLESPKYERPKETIPPVNPVSLTVEGAIHNESPDGVELVPNADNSVTAIFKRQYAALNFYLPDNAQMYYSNYKSVALTYTSEGGGLGHALYDAEMVGSSNAGAGKHPDWGKKIVESKTENTIIFKVTPACVGSCIRGFQIFNPDKLEDGKTIKITIKSLIFSDKEDPTAEDLIPAPTAEPTATPVPTAEPTADPTATPLPTPTVTPVPVVTREPGEYGISNPAAEGENITWDRVSFGTYYQSLYVPKKAPASPAEGTAYTDSDGTEMIYTGGKYYKKEPVLWRVLSVNGDDALLIADQNIDSQPYDDENSSSMTWEDSSIRRWLNETFYTSAFDENGRNSINEETLSPEPNPQYGTENGAETEDKVYLLSLNEVTNKNYGFAIHFDRDSKTRQAKNTAYAKARGAWTNGEGDYAENGWWWLRSMGSFAFDAAYVGSEGLADRVGFLTVNTGGGIRPALHINLKSNSWKKVDTVSTKSVEELQPSPVPTENPVKQVELEEVSISSACGYYDEDDEKIHIDDSQTGNGDSTFMYFPIPLNVEPGEKIRVTVSGSKWGTDDFRIWTTPQGLEGEGKYVEDPYIYLKPTVNPDGSFKGAVELMAKDKTCNRITIKAGWNTKIKNLVISEITVEKVKN